MKTNLLKALTRKVFKLEFWKKLSLEIIFFVVVFSALSYWQETSLLDSKSRPATIIANTLDGQVISFPDTDNMPDKTLIYFFAPWCKVCHISISNLNILRSQVPESKLDIIIVALDWKSNSEITEYMAEHELTFPVIMGDQQWLQQYKIKGFPTYYVLDKEAQVISRSIGYSSSVGMLRRVLLN